MSYSFQFALASRLCRLAPPLLARQLRNILYPPAQATKDKFELVARAQTGSKLKVSTADYHGYRFALHGYHDWRTYAIACALFKQSDTIVEIGANIGTETVGFADIVGRAGKIYAFEPLPYNLQSLQDMLDQNQFRNIQVFPFAVGNQAERVLFQFPDERNSGTGRVTRERTEAEARHTVEIDCVTLDKYQDEFGIVQGIFIDAEGSELSILQGGRNMIGNSQPILLLEAAPETLSPAGLNQLYALLTEMSYQVFQIRGLNLTRLEAEGISGLGKSNWLCFPEKKMDLVEAARKNLRTCGILPCIKSLNPLTHV